MSLVNIKLDRPREWVMQAESIPSSAITSRDAKFHFVKEGDRVPSGSICVECLRNQKGIYASIVMPNGYSMPTGRTAPRDSWFPMLKNYLRQWLVVSAEGRIVRAANEGIASFRQQLLDVHDAETDPGQMERAGKINEAIVVLEGFRARAMSELPAGAGEADILKAYYAWVVATAKSVGITQRDVILIIEREKRSGNLVEVQGLETSVLSGKVEFERFLDL